MEVDVNHLLDFDFDFFVYLIVAFVSFIGYCSFICSFFGQLFDFKDSFAFGIGGCLVGFALDFQGDLCLFHGLVCVGL